MSPSYPCLSCTKPVKNNQNAVLCVKCDGWIHLRCSSLDTDFFNSTLDWICDKCLLIELPTNIFEDSNDNIDEELCPQTNCNVEYESIETCFAQCSKKSTLISHLNIRSLRGKHDHLKYLLLNTPFDIFSLSETWLDKSITNAEMSIDGYSLERRDRNSTGGGVACYIKSDVTYRRRSDLECSNLEILWLEIINNGSSSMFVAVIYRPPDSTSDFFQYAEENIENVFNVSRKVVVLGDFNCNMLTSNPLSSKLNDMCTYLQLQQIIDKPTRVTDCSRTCIDLILIPSDVNCSNCFVCPLGLSDHSLIFVEFPPRTKLKTQPNVSKFRSFRHFNIEKFIDDGNSIKWDDFYASNDVEELWSLFRENFVFLCNKHAPFISVRRRKKPSPWINEEYTSLARERDHLKRKFDKHGALTDWTEYKKVRNKVNNLNKKLKKSYYLKELNDHSNDIKMTWKTLKNFCPSKKDSNLKILEGEKLISDPFEVACLFNEYFTKTNGGINGNENEAGFITSNITFKFSDISEDFVTAELKLLSRNKSPGPDELNPSLLKDGAPFLSAPLTHLLNASLKTGHSPKDWKRARITPIFKTGDKLSVKNYRPIAVLSHLMKILEKAVYSQAFDFIQAHRILHEQQSGFRPRHSTNTALLDVRDYLLQNIEEGYLTGALYLDLKGAFDSVSHQILIFKLSMYGFSGNELNWFRDYFTDRQQCVKISGVTSNYLPVNRGVPQGSLLGPFLFSLFINDVCELPFNINTKIALYADDTAIFCKSRSLPIAEKILQKELQTISIWLKKNELSLNVKKTKAMLIGTLGRVRNRRLNLTMEGDQIEQVNEFKYLGVIIDQHLTWKGHIDMISSKISQTIGYIYRIKKFLPNSSLILLYNSLILSNFDYCCTIWGTSAECNINKLQKMQNRYARLVLKADIRTSHTLMLSQLGWQSIKQRINYQFNIFTFKIINDLAPRYLKPLIRIKDLPIVTRNAKSLYIKTPKTEYYNRSFHVHASKLWNQLPVDVQTIPSLDMFKKECKLLSLKS